MKDYYVYVYCDIRKECHMKIGEYLFEYEPFYIGYGKKNRMFYHLKMKDNNLYKINKIKSIINDGQNPLIFKIKDELEQKDAAMLERYFINEIGTLIDVYGVKKGLLTNQTPGGDGGPTFFNRKLTEEHKDKIRKSNTGKKQSLESRKKMSDFQKNRNITISDDKKNKMLDGLKNMNNISRENISKATKGTKWIFNKELKINKRVKLEDIKNYLENGWFMGFIDSRNNFNQNLH